MKLDLPRSALIVVDVQNDFCPGGVLAVESGDQVIPPLNRLAGFFAAGGGKVVATQDWHPANHVSFAGSHENSAQGAKFQEEKKTEDTGEEVLWPAHCIQGKRGADFHEDLDLKPVNLIIRKGFRPHLDSYSAFFENDKKTSTGLDGFLKSLSIDTLVLGGLATDYCVLASALDAAKLGYKTIVTKDAIRGVNYPPGSVDKALKLLVKTGITLTSSEDIQ